MLHALCLALACLASPKQVDMPLPNASFEIDANHDGVPDQWRWNVGAGKATIELDETTKHSGKRSVKLTGLGPDARAFLQAPTIGVKPGQAYVFSCWAKSEGITAGKPVLGIARHTAKGKWDNWSYTLHVPRNQGWRHYNQLFTMPATTAKAAFRVWIERCNGTAWFDDVSLREYHPGKPGWTDDFKSLDLWRTHQARLTQFDGAAALKISEETDPMALFKQGFMERDVEIDLGKYPCLSVHVEHNSGLWALKVRPDAYLQLHTARSGRFYYDVREHLAVLGPREGGTPDTIKLRIEVANEGASVVVHSVSFLSEAPPRVAEEPVRRSRYVTPEVTLDGLKPGLRHPFVALSQEEIARAKSKGKAYETWLAGVRRTADAELKKPVNVPDEPSIYSMLYNCPQHGVPLRWRGGSPKEHLCPRGNHVVTGAVFDRERRIQKLMNAHRSNRLAQARLGMAYAFTQDERYARRSREILIEYVRKFPGYPYHSGRGEIASEGSGMRVSCEPLGEAGWLAAMARGYDLVASSECFSKEDHAAIRRMFAEDVKVSLRYDEGLSNRQAHHNLAVSAVGLILGDEFLIRRALGSLRYQLKHAVFGDGMWWECSPGYHFYAVRTLREVAETFQRVGIDAMRDPKLRLSFDAPLRFLLPDGTYPAVNDAHVGHKLRRNDFEPLYHYFRDPVYAGLLNAPGYKRENSSSYLVYGGKLAETAPLPQESWNFFQAGMSVLKTRGEAGLCVVTDYGHTVVGHGHMDKLNLILFAHGRTLAPDIGTASYFSPFYRFWCRQTLSHNTVVVDARSQKQERGRLTLFDGSGPIQVVQATANEAYPCLNMMRTLFVTPNYVVDFFRVVDDATDAELSAAPIDEIPHWTKYPWGTSSPASHRRDLTRFERSRDAHSGKYAAMIAQSMDQPAAWTTEIRRRTGPNRTIRDGIIPAEPGVEYELTAWVKTKDATGANEVRCNWLAQGARAIGSMVTKGLTGTHGWTKVTARGNAPAGTLHVQVSCISSQNEGAAWFDDITLTRKGSDKNILLPNPDFELVREPHQSVDYVLHAYGEFQCSVPMARFTGKLGEQTDDPTFDGRNSYRYLQDVRVGKTDAAWSARWDNDGSSVQVHMLPGDRTQVLTAIGPGPGSARLPMIMARRREANTVFAAVHDPFRSEPDVAKVTRLRTDSPAHEAYGIAVETPRARALYAVSFSPGAKRLDGMTLDGSLAGAELASDGRVNWLYVVDGKFAACDGASLTMPGSYHVTVVACDDKAKTITVRERLPEAEALRGAALTLGLPYNECYSVARVERNGDGSLIHLGGLPNLYLCAGAPAKVASRGFVRRLSDRLMAVSCNAPLELRIRRSTRPKRVHFRDADGRTGELPFEVDREVVILRFAKPQRNTTVAFDLQSADALKDGQPPRVTKIELDGREAEATPTLTVPFQPRRVVVTLEDASGVDVARSRVLVNAEAASARLVSSGLGATLTIADWPDPIVTVEATICDNALLRNERSFRLEAAPPVRVVPVKEASAGRVVKLIEQSASLRVEATLPKGEYEVNVISRAFSDGANSLWIDVDEERAEDAIHIPTDGFGNSSRSYELTRPMTRLTLTKDGKHTFVLTLREDPGPELDKMQFLRDGKVVREFECEALSGR